MATDFTCRRCGYTTNTKYCLISHLQRKKTCSMLVEDVSVDSLLHELMNKNKDRLHVCTTCGQRFTARQNMYRHRTKCTGQNSKQDIKTVVREVLQEMSSSSSMASMETNNGTINNTINNGTVNNTHIHVHAFGKEDVNYLKDHPNYASYMIKCIRDKAEGVVEYLVRKHFDAQHPENHTIKKINKKDEFMEYYNGRSWKLRYSDDLLEDAFTYLMADFADFVAEEIGDGTGRLKKIWVENFMKAVGTPLEWDLSVENENQQYAFEPNQEVSQEERDRMRVRIFKLAEEYIYRKSKDYHNHARKNGMVEVLHD